MRKSYQSDKPLVSIIIVNWNGSNDLKTCLPSLLKLRYKPIEILIVDNGSTDDSLIRLKQFAKAYKKVFQQIHIMQIPENLGYAEGNNIGYKKAKGQLLLLLNNDTIITDDVLTPLVAKITADPLIAAVQPKILQYPNKKLIDSIGSYFIGTGFLYHIGHNKPGQSKYHKDSEVFSVKGACMLLRKSAIDKVGLFDTNYFAYFEETDLCMRLWLAGYKVIYFAHATIYHKGGETFKKLPNSLLLFHSYKNRIATYTKNFELRTLVRVLPLHLLTCLIVMAMYFITLQFSLGFAVMKALVWNVISLKSILGKRKAIQEIRTISDSHYLPQVTRNVRLSYYYHLFTTSLKGYKD